MSGNGNLNGDHAPAAPTTTVDLHPTEPNLWEALQRRIARRADELSRDAPPSVRRGPGRLLWVKAEREILGSESRVGLVDLLQVCARLSPRCR